MIPLDTERLTSKISAFVLFSSEVLEVGVANEYGVHVGTGILVQLVVAGDHNNSNLHIAQDAQLIGLLQQSCLTLAECDLYNKRVHT